MKLFYNVDTQKDFMNSDGTLYVADSDKIKKNLKDLTYYAIQNNIRIVSSKDWHNEKTEEISKNPDFKNTFPKHCMNNTIGAEFIEETNHGSVPIDWDREYSKEFLDKLISRGNVTILKDKFNVISGNKNSEKIFDILKDNYDEVYIYGVVSEICVKFAVEAFIKTGIKVFLVEDAIKELDMDSFKKNLKIWEESDNFFKINTNKVIT